MILRSQRDRASPPPPPGKMVTSIYFQEERKGGRKKEREEGREGEREGGKKKKSGLADLKNILHQNFNQYLNSHYHSNQPLLEYLQ